MFVLARINRPLVDAPRLALAVLWRLHVAMSVRALDIRYLLVATFVIALMQTVSTLTLLLILANTLQANPFSGCNFD